MRRILDALAVLGVAAILTLGLQLAAGTISGWDSTLPDGSSSVSVPTGLNELDDYIRERTADIQTAWAVEHVDNGSHVLPYGTTTLRTAYAAASGTTGNIFYDSTDGFWYRWSGSAWVRLEPIGLEATFTTDATPDVDNVDRLKYTDDATITEIEDGYVGQTIRIMNTDGTKLVTIDHTDGGTENIITADISDVALDETGDMIILTQWADGYWREDGRNMQ